MKEATIYYVQDFYGRKINGSRKIEVPDDMYNGWDWDGIVKQFRNRYDRDPHSLITVKRIKLGRTILQG